MIIERNRVLADPMRNIDMRLQLDLAVVVAVGRRKGQVLNDAVIVTFGHDAA